MNRLATLACIGVVVTLAMSAPAPARAQSLLFDYVGFDYEYPKLGPTFGSLGNGYQGVGEVQVVAAPLVSDQTNYQYTYYFDGLVASNVQTSGSFEIITYTGPGTLTIYEDSRSSGTAADYGTNPPNAVAPPTFVDGTAILVGSLSNFQYIFNTSTGSGSFQADFTATGGSQLGNLPLDQRTGWTFAGTTGNSVTIPNGYAHQVKGQTFINPPLPTQNTTWGGLKTRYR
jgi:hypothetical protein